jgi:hypothetical protein
VVLDCGSAIRVWRRPGRAAPCSSTRCRCGCGPASPGLTRGAHHPNRTVPPATPRRCSTAVTVKPSTPGLFVPRLPATRSNATISVAGSCTKLTGHRTGGQHRPPPSGAAWLPGRIPRSERRHSATHLAALQSSFHTPSLSSFPCGRLSRPRSTTATPPRPGAFSRQCAYPTHQAASPLEGSRHRPVPVFTAAPSIEEEASSVPAASPWLRRRPSPWPPRTLISPAREIPDAAPSPKAMTEWRNAGGDSGLEALRVLKRRRSDVVYAALQAALAAQPRIAAA